MKYYKIILIYAFHKEKINTDVVFVLKKNQSYINILKVINDNKTKQRTKFYS